MTFKIAACLCTCIKRIDNISVCDEESHLRYERDEILKLANSGDVKTISKMHKKYYMNQEYLDAYYVLNISSNSNDEFILKLVLDLLLYYYSSPLRLSILSIKNDIIYCAEKIYSLYGWNKLYDHIALGQYDLLTTLYVAHNSYQTNIAYQINTPQLEDRIGLAVKLLDMFAVIDMDLLGYIKMNCRVTNNNICELIRFMKVKYLILLSRYINTHHTLSANMEMVHIVGGFLFDANPNYFVKETKETEYIKSITKELFICRSSA